VLGVLATGAENVQVVALGDEATLEVACVAAADALVAAAGVFGRQEYRLTLADTDMIVLPGLDEDGVLDVSSLRDAGWSVLPDHVSWCGG